MKTKTLLISWITTIIVIGLVGCSNIEFSPSPKGTQGPSEIDVTSSRDAIVIKDTGKLVANDYPLDDFSQIEVSDFFSVEVRQGESHWVVVKAEDTLMPYIDVHVRGETLQVGLKPGYIFNFENASQRIEVTLPALTGIRISNHSTLILEGFETEETFQIVLADFGTLSGSLAANVVQVEVTNHSELKLSGSASQVVGQVMGFSSADLTGLETPELDIETDTHSILHQ